jgi:hypothetical protein
MTPYSPPLHTVYTWIQYTLREGGRGELTREKVRGAIVHKAGSKIPTSLSIKRRHLKDDI